MTASPARQSLRTPALFPEGLVAGRFEIVSVLGVGGTGTVFEAVDLERGGAVALKAIPRDERMHRRARREMRVAATLDHPAIVSMIDTVEDEDYVYVIFELVRGQDLAAAFREGLLDDAAVLRAVAAVCDALAHAHAHGVVHRDVKPGNVLLRDDGVLKLTDFGIALVDHPDATVDDRLLGTLSYMSPEQALGERIESGCDVWSAALMAYEVLAGDNPYRARTPRELAARHSTIAVSLTAERPDLPPVVLRTIDRALQRATDKRPSAAALRDALLVGARQLERGMVTDSEPTGLDPLDVVPVAARRFRRLRRRLASRATAAAPKLRLVPGGAGTAAAPAGASSAPAALGDLARRLGALRVGAIPTARLPAVGERGSRLAATLLTAAAAIALTSALPFYPASWPLLLGVLCAGISLLRPRLAAVAVGLLFLPLVGNVAGALVVPVAVVALAWAVLTAAEPRRAALPVLAPLAAAAWLLPLYLIAAGGARRAHVRAALGAAGPVAVTLACGLTGRVSPLSGTIPGVGLSQRIAESGRPLQATSAVLAAAGGGLAIQALAGALLAVGARPLYRLLGAQLRWFSSCWLGAVAVALVLGPALAGAEPAPFAPAAVGVAVTGILLGLRSAAPEPAVKEPES